MPATSLSHPAGSPLRRFYRAWALAALMAPLALVPLRARADIAFTDMSAAAGVELSTESFGASFGDLNGDGYLDIFANNHRLQDSVYMYMGNGTFLDTAGQVRTFANRPNSDTHGGVWADYDNDGDQDLLVSTGTGNPAYFFVNEGGGLFDRTISLGVDAPAAGGRMAAWLDFNGDRHPDFIIPMYSGATRLWQQNPEGSSFTDFGASAGLACTQYHYLQLLDVNNDGRLDVLCASGAANFPQKIYDTHTLPWTKLFDGNAPNGSFPRLLNVADDVIADFDNDGRMDMFAISGVQLRTSSVVQENPNYFESLLTGGNKGFKFVTNSTVTFEMDWNKSIEGTTTDLSAICIGANCRHPTAIPFTLSPTDPTVVGMAPTVTVQTQLPQMRVGYDTKAKRWSLIIQTKLDTATLAVFSDAYIRVSTGAPLTNLQGTALWPTDLPAAPTLLMNLPQGGFTDRTVVSGLSAPIQCVSATAGDFDNDMDVDLYLACRTGASNITNILYENQGNGHFVAAPGAAGAAGPIGIAVASGAGTADSAVSGDYDVDGFLDLFVTNGFNLRPLNFGGPNKLYHNNGNGNHWVELDLAGTLSDRDATGARVYATANGVTQLRVQNGGYHRWSQDSRRAHFGLAGAMTVDLSVEWPSGAVENFSSVAADKLYRITEGSGIAQVQLGVAPAYPCGAPTINAAVDKGVFIWRDCPSGEWRTKTAAGGTTINYALTVTSSAPYTSVKAVGLNSQDSLDYTTDRKVIDLHAHTVGASSDGVNFIPVFGSTNCLAVNAPVGVQVFVGPFRKQVTQPFDLVTQSSCGP